MSLVLQSSGGGSVTIQEPATASNFTQTLPAATGNVVLDSTAGICRAWVNFNGTGTVAIRASYNVSSITDNGTGDYTVNFSTALSDANYVTSLTGAGSSGGDYPLVSVLTGGNPSSNNPTLYSTTQVRIRMSSSSPTVANLDTTYYGVAVFR
jgi:hypothetical protein